jgi:KH/beta-lactamase-domain protein
METTDPLEEIKRIVKEKIPPESFVTRVDFEGPEVVIYTKNPNAFTSNGEIIKDLARTLRKRIVLRPDSSVLADAEEASENIKKIVPEDAGIADIKYDAVFNEVIIEAVKPGLVIGKSGSTLNEIRDKVGWTPKVIRASPIKSKIVENIRTIQLRKSDEKKEILRRVGKRIHRPMFSKSQWVRMSIFGGFREVGRMAQYVHTPESKVLIDCGINVAANDAEHSFPYLNMPEFRLQELDAVVVSHAHLDHCGFVPYLFHMGYDGPVYCTPPTRDLMYLLQWDYLDVIEREGRNLPYTRTDIKKAVTHAITLEYNEITDISPDMRLTLYNAGHILGSSMVHLHIKEGLYNLAYTGDFKFEKSRLFDAANTHFPRLETLIMESTYGGAKSIQQPRRQSEDEVIKQINDTVLRGGKVLVPVFAVGRAQELLVVIEEYANQGVLEEVPVYLDGMIWEATGIHTTYPSYLNRSLQNQIFHQGRNPFLADMFKKVKGQSERQEVIDGEPCVILATSGMLAGGPVMEYLKAFTEDEKNTLIFVGYQAEGSLGRRIQKGWKEIPLKENGKTRALKMNMQIHTVDGFSGHSDRNQLMNYVRRLNQKPERILTCHGEESKCTELAYSLYKTMRTETKAPQNIEVLRLK